MSFKRIAIIGAGGAIGGAFVQKFSELDSTEKIYSFSRKNINYYNPKISHTIFDYNNEKIIEEAAKYIENEGALDLVIVATGILHDGGIMPEKSIKEITSEKLSNLFYVNTIIPALIIRYFMPLLNKENKSVIACLSARIGSITDNYLGGWYSYRASKAALNMIIKTASIELSRKNKYGIIVGLHPGTVDSKLSKPFQQNINKDKLFTAEFATGKLIEVLKNINVNDTGQCFAWDGKEITP